MNGHVAILGLAAWLTSCASVSTPEQFREAEPVTVQVCSTKSVAQSRQALADAWARCWVKGGSGANSSRASVFVTIDDTPDTSTVAVVHSPGMGASNIVLQANIRRTRSCASEVVVRGRALYAEHTKVWLDNPFDKGPGTACL